MALERVRAVSQDARGATFEVVPSAARFDSVAAEGRIYARVSMSGAYAAERPGRPALPTIMVPVGVPDGMSARLRVQSADWETRSGLPPPLPAAEQRYVADDPKTGPVSEIRIEPDPAVYRGSAVYPAEAALLGGYLPLGDRWMVSARVRPVRYDPRRGTYSILKRMTLRVEFVSASDRERASRPALRPGVAGGPWERVQRSMLENYETARAFPRRAAAPMRPAAPRAAAVNPEFKLEVTASGWSTVSYAALAAAGFPSGIDIATIGVWERGYDDAGDSATATPIPVVARDANTNGVFEAGDAITFYARNLRDRMGPLSIENRYTYANTYWLTWTGTPAARTDSVSGVIVDPSPERPVSFRQTVHLFQDAYLLSYPSATAGSPIENVEYFFWTTGSCPDAFETTIPFFDPEPADSFRIQARYQGNTLAHRLNIFFQGSAAGAPPETLALDQTFSGTNVYQLDTGFTIPSSLIGAGPNRYTHAGAPCPGAGSRAMLDWIDVTYSRRYVARSDMLEFTSGSATGIAEIHVSGFTQPTIEVYDITSPTAARRVTPIAVSVGPAPYEIYFRTDASAGERRFVALVPGAELPIAGSVVSRDTPSALGAPSSQPGALGRAVFVTPGAFLVPANRLADHRRGQGYAVEVAAVQDVYDEFNGGVKSAAAIRRYFLHAYKTWISPPAFALLLGDASMDYQRHLPTSGVDWVPTYLEFETIDGPNGRELVADDAYYVLNLAGGTTDPSIHTPSMFLGRVPASSAAELDQFVTKVIQYENFLPTDTWRGRQVLVSDDEYSTTIFFTTGYCLQPFEGTFRAANQDMAAAAAGSASGSDIPSELFDLKYFTDQLAVSCADPPNGPNCRKWSCVVDAFQRIGGAIDSFHNNLARGALIANFEAHANRYLISHEYIYYTFNGDLDRLSNYGRPFFSMVWGCHANQFADGPAGAFTDSTDAIGEQWLMLPDRGSIAALGSSAYERIDTNYAMNSFVADAFYSTPPAPPPIPGETHQARWILGEIIGQAYVRNALSAYFPQQAMNRTVNLLGDPMLRMDALPPRIFEVTLDGSVVPDGGSLTTDSPTDSLSLVAKVRDEAGLERTELAERAVPGGAVTPLDLTLYAVAVSDTGRAHTLTARVRPRVGNYDLLVRSFDQNDRERTFALQIRTATSYFANSIPIVSGQFIVGDAVLRAEVTTPIPVTADSLSFLVDGLVVAALTKTPLDATGRRWALETLPEQRGPGPHTLDVAISGRLGDFAQVSVTVDTGFTLRGLAVVSPRLMGTGCGGSVFQFELSAPAPRVDLLLMSVSGRRVASLNLTASAGFNTYCWDGRDSQGHETATGVYFYRLTATDASGRTASQSGRMIRSR